MFFRKSLPRKPQPKLSRKNLNQNSSTTVSRKSFLQKPPAKTLLQKSPVKVSRKLVTISHPTIYQLNVERLIYQICSFYFLVFLPQNFAAKVSRKTSPKPFAKTSRKTSFKSLLQKSPGSLQKNLPQCSSANSHD